jgi:hypothetical protein
MDVVSDDLIELLNTHFFKEEKFIRTYNSNSDWWEVDRNIQPREIRSHFSGSYYIGFISRNTASSILVFDLDCHSAITEKTLINRKNKIISLFGNPDFIFSTPNGGLHLYYLLNKEYHPKEIQSIVKNIIRIRAGEIEFYPNGHGIRLFGGKNCMLRDNKLKTVNIYFEDYVLNVWEYNERLDLDSLVTTTSDYKKKYSPSFISECEFLLENGLYRPSSKNESFLDLNRYLQGYQGLNAEETKEKLQWWIKNKNNRLSKDWTKNSSGVYKQIHEVVKRFDSQKIGCLKKPSFPIHLLSPKDKVKIKEIALTISIETDISLNKVECFLQDIISYCKYNQTGGMVEIPKGVFQSCRYGSGTRYFKLKNALLKSNTLTLIKNYSADLHKCNKYKILDEFC